ncbi:hypothetical protein KC367_g188 [Hortaea werneckii]|nr:hypothetical protein KC367_g188 [Hortaea werneckii]
MGLEILRVRSAASGTCLFSLELLAESVALVVDLIFFNALVAQFKNLDFYLSLTVVLKNLFIRLPLAVFYRVVIFWIWLSAVAGLKYLGR